jgi:hypothetical protein
MPPNEYDWVGGIISPSLFYRAHAGLDDDVMTDSSMWESILRCAEQSLVAIYLTPLNSHVYWIANIRKGYM